MDAPTTVPYVRMVLLYATALYTDMGPLHPCNYTLSAWLQPFLHGSECTFALLAMQWTALAPGAGGLKWGGGEREPGVPSCYCSQKKTGEMAVEQEPRGCNLIPHRPQVEQVTVPE